MHRLEELGDRCRILLANLVPFEGGWSIVIPALGPTACLGPKGHGPLLWAPKLQDAGGALQPDGASSCVSREVRFIFRLGPSPSTNPQAVKVLAHVLVKKPVCKLQRPPAFTGVDELQSRKFSAFWPGQNSAGKEEGRHFATTSAVVATSIPDLSVEGPSASRSPIETRVAKVPGFCENCFQTTSTAPVC